MIRVRTMKYRIYRGLYIYSYTQHICCVPAYNWVYGRMANWRVNVAKTHAVSSIASPHTNSLRMANIETFCGRYRKPIGIGTVTDVASGTFL